MTQLVIVVGLLGSPFAIAVGLLIWGGASLLFDAWRCRHPRGDPGERRLPYVLPSVADEAERWLKTQG